MTNKHRLPSSAQALDRDWQLTQPAELPETPARKQAPLKEVLKGLELRELEGETLFDQLFGPDSGV